MGVFWESPAAIVAKLEDSTWFLRKAAVEALGKLPAEALQAHAAALVAKLEDSDGVVCLTGRRWISLATQTSHLRPSWYLWIAWS